MAVILTRINYNMYKGQYYLCEPSSV